MKKQIIILAVICLALITIPREARLGTLTLATQFCEEQGYTYSDSDGMCIFDDNNSCWAIDFYTELCGEEYIKNLECIKAGKMDTPAASCCLGLDYLVPYEMDEDDNCVYKEWDVHYICSECGNGICEEWENPCSCRADCRLPGDDELVERLKGKILLQVQEKGEAWYVYPNNGQRYYMSDGFAAYGVMRTLGLGISNENLNKIPIGILENDPTLIDSDNDGLDDKLEEAIGTDPNNNDSDNDGNIDNIEVINGFNPLGSGMISHDMALADNLKGKILLQVEGRGEAWYVNMDDKKRYYLKDGETAYQVMSRFGLGITNENLWPIARGKIFIPYHNKTNTILANNSFYMSLPYGWSYITPGKYEEIKFSNTSLQDMLNYQTDNSGTDIGIRISINIQFLNYGESEHFDRYLANKIEKIITCEEGEGRVIEIDNLEFQQCTDYDSGYQAFRQIGDKYLFIFGSFRRYKTLEYKYDYETETIEKILSTIDFIE